MMKKVSTSKTRKGTRYLKKGTIARRVLFKQPVAWRTAALAGRSVGLGTSATTVLRTSFFTNVTGAAGTGVFTGYLKPGSCFDPCGDLAAVQPQMFDQFAAAYNRYKVNSCVIRIKINGKLGAGPATHWVAAAYPAVDATPLATYQAAASQQYAKTTSSGFALATTQTTVGVGAEGKYLSFKLNHDAVVGAKSDTWDIGASVGTDPTALQYMVLPIFLQGDQNGAHTWMLEIDIWQNVTFSQKKNTVDA